MFLDEFEIRFHGPMVRPLIIHEFVEFSTGVFAAKTTELYIFVFRTPSELALFNILINDITLTTTTVFSATCAAIQTTRTIL
jgi:hypothetical protein